MARNYIDYKVTVWHRLHLKNGINVDNIVGQLEGKIIKTSDDLINEVNNWDDVFDNEDETLYDTSEDMKREENGDAPTIEIYKKEQLVWSN